MPEVAGVNKIFSIWAKKKCGRFNQYGTFQLGHSWFGDEDIIWPIAELGIFVLGINRYGDIIPLSGTYRTDQVTGKTRNYREPYYIPKNPRSPEQQANRAKYAAGIVVWQGLTSEEKILYNKRAMRLHMSGYNLFLREYLLSN